MTISKAKLISVAIGAFLMMFCAGIVNNSTTYFILSVTDYLGCSRTAFSIYFTIITICTAVMSMAVHSLISRIGLRKGMLLGSLCVSGGFVLLSQLRALWMVYLAAILIGIFQSFILVPTVSVINSWFENGSETVTGIVMSASGFGGLMMGLIMPSVVAYLNWRTGYMVCAILFFAFSMTACILAGGKPPVEKSTSKNPRQKEKTDDYRRLLSTPAFWILILTAMITGGVNMISQQFSVILEIRGYNVALVSAIMGSMSIALAFFKILEGFLSARFSVKVFAPLIFLTGTIGYIALLFPGTPALLIGVLGWAISGAGCTVLYPTIMSRLYGSHLATQAWGICWAGFMIGQAVCSTLYPIIYDATGSYNPGLVFAAVTIAASAAVLYLLMHREERSNKAGV